MAAAIHSWFSYPLAGPLGSVSNLTRDALCLSVCLSVMAADLSPDPVI